MTTKKTDNKTDHGTFFLPPGYRNLGFGDEIKAPKRFYGFHRYNGMRRLKTDGFVGTWKRVSGAVTLKHSWEYAAKIGSAAEKLNPPPAQKKAPRVKAALQECPKHKEPVPPNGMTWKYLGKGPINREEKFSGYYVSPAGTVFRKDKVSGKGKSYFYFEAVAQEPKCPKHKVPVPPNGMEWKALGFGSHKRKKRFCGYYVTPSGLVTRGGYLSGAIKSFFYFEAVPIDELECPLHTPPTCPPGHEWVSMGWGYKEPDGSKFYGYCVDRFGRASSGSMNGGNKSGYYFKSEPIITAYRNTMGMPLPEETPAEVGTKVHEIIEKHGLQKLDVVSALKEKAPYLLKAAADTILERGAQRDLPEGERSMARAVQAFNALTGQKLSETDGWLFMTILKISRHQGGSFHRDDLQDGIAYLALALESELKDQL